MNEIYTLMVAILGILALSGLFVGVTNDAVNFLTSAIGSKAASIKTILSVASVGIIIGVVTSSGMMEVARSGMFAPAMFTFTEVMTLYLAVMFANIILLDLYNSLGLPTSTTVSLIFCLLGAAIAVSIKKIADTTDLGIEDLGQFINTSRAMGIVSAILLSVIIAFTCGSIVMYISRLIFSFRYSVALRRFGAVWCGISITAIIYFAIFKGLKTALAGNEIIQFADQHLVPVLFGCWVLSSALLFFLQCFKVNILRITILAGTFALALSFAGNDLVNFIGVPVAGLDAYNIAHATGDVNMTMEALAENVPANFWILLGAGGVMILTLWTSKKAMQVAETELSLAAQDEDSEQLYGSSVFSRTIVRAALNINHGFDRIMPKRLKQAIENRFIPQKREPGSGPFDMIRATVNLTTAALLISTATALKLPLSTTYVCFMVAMGSSLADRAWGRESAVYRISGVMTVVAGWFVTALGGFLIALAVGFVLIYGGTVAFMIVTLLCGRMLWHSNFSKKKKSKSAAKEKANTTGMGEIITDLRQEVCATMEQTTRLYDRTLLAVMKENRKELRHIVQEANELFYASREHKYTLLPTLRRLQGGDVTAAHYYVQIVDYLNEMTKALLHITRPAFDHIDNNHEGLSKDQARDLMAINDEVETINHCIYAMLRSGDLSDTEMVLSLRDQLFESIGVAVDKELERIHDKLSHTKASMLYLTILNETKNMVLQSRNLMKAQEFFIKNNDNFPIQR